VTGTLPETQETLDLRVLRAMEDVGVLAADLRAAGRMAEAATAQAFEAQMEQSHAREIRRRVAHVLIS
jgi:transcriptional regulator of aromatic amino acid metabolism